ncbi:MAG: hypothetical protein NC123_19625, partial [Butyrivibrio sp.]|nr:hypothetical protein [Butyrivibrio sp.]
MQLPDIVKQIGKADEKERVYIEDYVYTYLHGLKAGTGDSEKTVGVQRTFPMRVALFGHAFQKEERKFYLIYGASNVIEELEKGKSEEQIRKEYFEEYVCGMMSSERRKCFSIDRMKNLLYEDISWAFQIFSLGCNTGLGTYECLFNQFFDSFLKKLNMNEEMLDEAIALSRQYPIIYSKDMETTFIWKYKSKEPYIEIEIPYPNLKEEFRNKKYRRYADVYLEDYETTIVLLRFCNMPMSNYTAHYLLEKNEYTSLNDFRTHSYVEVEWGNWVSQDVCELKITKNNDDSLGKCIIKITVDEVESAVAFIKSSMML